MNKLLCFKASWCQPCKAMKNIIFKLQKDYPDRVLVYDLDSTDDKPIFERYGVTIVPTFILVDDEGSAFDKYKGQLTEATLRYILTKYDE